MITDFSTGDVLAIGVLLTGFSPGREPEFVRLVDNGKSTTVQVDHDGATNGSTYDSIAVLNGITASTLTTFVSAGQIEY